MDLGNLFVCVCLSILLLAVVDSAQCATPETNSTSGDDRVVCQWLGGPGINVLYNVGLSCRNDIFNTRLYNHYVWRGAVKYDFLPGWFGGNGSDDLLLPNSFNSHRCLANGSMYLRYDGATKEDPTGTLDSLWWNKQSQREDLKMKAPVVVVNEPDKKACKMVVEDGSSAITTCFLTIKAGDPCLYYSFVVEAKRDLKDVGMDLYWGSKPNFNFFAVDGSDTPVPFKQRAGFSKWASIYSSGRGDGLMVILDGDGDFELVTGYEWWVVGTFKLSDMKAGEKKQFGLAIRYMKDLKSPLEDFGLAYRDTTKHSAFIKLRDEALTLVSAPETEMKPVSPYDAYKMIPYTGAVHDLKWAQERAKKHKVIRILHNEGYISSGVGGHGDSRLSLPEIKQWIDVAAEPGCFNAICLSDCGSFTVKDWGVENWREVIRYTHKKGMLFFIECSHNMQEVIDLLYDPNLGDGCGDGFGFDYEKSGMPLYVWYYYSLRDVPSGDNWVAEFNKDMGKDMKDATVDELRRWLAQEWVDGYGNIYDYLKKKNPNAMFWTTACWYDTYFARGLAKRCPGIIVETYEYNLASDDHYRNFIKCWQDAGVITLPIVYYGISVNETNVVRSSMEAGADGISIWLAGTTWSKDPTHSKIIAMDIMRYFPGGLDKPFAEHKPTMQELYPGHGPYADLLPY